MEEGGEGRGGDPDSPPKSRECAELSYKLASCPTPSPLPDPSGVRGRDRLFLRDTNGVFIRGEAEDTLPFRNRGLLWFPFWLQKSIESRTALHFRAESPGVLSESSGTLGPGFSGHFRGL